MRKSILLPLISAVCILAYIIVVDSVWSWRDIASQWQQVGWWLLLVAIALMLFTHLVRTCRFYEYFNDSFSEKGFLTFSRLFSISQVHNFLNSLLPFRSGELSFPALMKLEFGVPLLKSGSGLLWMRFLDLHTLGWFVLLIFCYTLQFSISLSIALLLAAFVVPILMYAFAKKIESVLLNSQISPNETNNLVSKVKQLLLKLLDGIPKNPSKFLSTWFLTLVNWAVKFFAMALVIILLMSVTTGINVASIVTALAGAVGGEVSAILPIHAPAGVGTYPAGVYFGMQLVGATGKHLFELGVSVHAMIMISAIIGVIVAQILSALIQILRKNK